MRALIPNVTKDGTITEWLPKSDKEGMQLNYKAGNKHGMRVMYNKPPKWNEGIFI